MSLDRSQLEDLARFLSNHPAIVEKAVIEYAYEPARGISGQVELGDDCAAIPDPVGGGHLLFAAEGMLPSFVERDPWFAGYSAVMVNLSDVAAMGGRPIAITDVLWSPDSTLSDGVWGGMKAASVAYDVPIVGGHTTRIAPDGRAGLAAAVLGRAGDHLITSFDAQPDDHLIVAVDLGGALHNGQPFWNASTQTSVERLRKDLELLPLLAESGCCAAGKDISNGGIVGTLAMLCHCSEVGAILDLDRLPIPGGLSMEQWLVAFPSYGYLLAISDAQVSNALQAFEDSSVTVAACGRFCTGQALEVRSAGRRACLRFGGVHADLP